jgi:hypothetical protein
MTLKLVAALHGFALIAQVSILLASSSLCKAAASLCGTSAHPLVFSVYLSALKAEAKEAEEGPEQDASYDNDRNVDLSILIRARTVEGSTRGSAAAAPIFSLDCCAIVVTVKVITSCICARYVGIDVVI